MDKTRVLVAGPIPPPVGGVETVTEAILQSTAFERFEVRHCDLTKGRKKETQGKFDLGNMLWAIIHFVRMMRSVNLLRPHVVYMPVATTWSGFWRDMVLAWIAKRRGAKLVGHIHGPKIADVLAKRGMIGSVIRPCIGQFDILLVLGEAWKGLLEGYGYQGQVAVVPSTLNRGFFDVANAFHREHECKSPVGLFVGQVGRRKGVFDLLAALHLLKAAGRPAKVMIVGPPEYSGEWDELMAKRDELAVNDVAEFAGPLQGEALYERFRKASYFVLPSYREGLPVVLFEAAAFELPVIATPVGVSADLLEHERNCLLVRPGNVEEIASTIERMRDSVTERSQYACQLKKDIERYHPDNVCGLIANIIASVA
jgi:glycosyltransferase involved in cell wall biosynthesis